MNEMKLLEQFRAAVAPPDQGTLAQARARLLESADPPDPSGRSARGPRRPGARRRPVLLGAAAAVIAVAAAVAVMLPSGSSRSPRQATATLTAATVLHRAALAALSALTPRGRQYLYIDFEFIDPAVSPSVSRVQQWQSVDGSRLTMVRIDPCGRRPVRHCAPYLLSYLVPRVRHIFTYAGLATLPTEPGALLSYLYGEQIRACAQVGVPIDRPRSRMGRAAVEWSGISTILGDVPVLPPRFGAALFEAATRIPGVRVIRNVSNGAGGRGIAVTRAFPEARPDRGAPESSALIFRPLTYQYIGNAIRWPDGTVLTGLRVGTFARTAPAASRVTNRAPLTPSAGETCALGG
jgi:hypothetical protein